MLIFHPDISLFPKPALKKRDTTAPSTPPHPSSRSRGTVPPGAPWMSLRAHLGAARLLATPGVCPPSLLRPPFPGAPALHRHVGLPGGLRAPVTCWLSPGSHPSLRAAEAPPPARLAPLPQATRPLGPTVAWREL